MGLFDIFKKKTNTAAQTEASPQTAPDKDSDQPATAADSADTLDTPAKKSDSPKQKPTPDASEPQEQPTESTSISDNPAPPATDSKSQTATPEQTSSTAETTTTTEGKETISQETGSTAADTAKYNAGLTKTRHRLRDRFNAFLANFRSVDEEFFDDLEDLLIQSDVGYEMALKISDALRNEVKLQNAQSKADVSRVIVQKMAEIYYQDSQNQDYHLNIDVQRPLNVILFVGVNGAGKTTTIGKLAARLKKDGQKVILAAADTFRAGAIEQLQVWGNKVGVQTVAHAAGSDPASVVYDALQLAQQEHANVLLVDTAGRLQNNTNLMKELEKIKRIITREIPDAPHEVLLVIDATTGQNALVQAKQFQKATQVTGLVLAKLDGSSQGGIVLAINDELHLPVKLVGLGEQMDDLRDFDPEIYAQGLFSQLFQDEAANSHE